MSELFRVGDANNPLMNPIMRAMMSGGDPILQMRALSPLLDKAQVQVDTAVVDVGLERLVFAADLLAEGLVYPLADPLSVTQLEWDQHSKVGSAIRTMTPGSRSENSLLDAKHNRIPIYITQEEFDMGIRLLKMSERVGQPLDVSQIKQATRRANESVEDACINGATTADGQTFQDSGYTAPGLLTAPGTANNVTNSVDWTAANVIGTTGPDMQADILAGVAKLNAAKKYGPFNLYVGTNAGATLQGQFSLYTPGTIQGMLESMTFGGRNLRIRVADRMPNTNSSGDVQWALVQMTDDVVQLVNGQPPTVVPWTSLDGMHLHWLVMAIMVPRVRCDYDGNSGICTGKKS